MRRKSNFRARDHRTLHETVLSNDVDGAARILENGADVDARDGRMRTALHLAASHGTTAIATLLADKGAALDAREERNWTPLHICSAKGSTEIAAMLMERGVDLEARENKGWTPLHFCSNYGSTEVAAMLMERGVDLEARENQGATPLHICSHKGSTEIAAILIERGVDLEATDSNDWTPLHFCSQGGSTMVATMLMERGVNVNAVAESNVTALHLAVVHGHVHILEELLRHDARTDVQRVNRNTALHFAARGNQLQALLMLLARAMADIVNLKNGQGRTALHTAATMESEPIVKALMHAGARLDIKDNEGKIPIDYVDQDPLRTILTWNEKTIAPSCAERVEGAAEIPDEDNDDSESLLKTATSQTMPESEMDKKDLLAFAHEKEPQELNVGPNQPVLQHDLVDSEDDVSSASSLEAGTWIPDEPYGSWYRLVNALGALKPGQVFFDEWSSSFPNPVLKDSSLVI